MRICGAKRHDQGIDGKGRLALMAEPLRVAPHGVASVPMLNNRGRNRQGPKSREGQGIRICAGAWFAFAPPAPLVLALLFNLERRRRGWRGRHLIPAPRDARRRRSRRVLVFHQIDELVHRVVRVNNYRHDGNRDGGRCTGEGKMSKNVEHQCTARGET